MAKNEAHRRPPPPRRRSRRSSSSSGACCCSALAAIQGPKLMKAAARLRPLPQRPRRQPTQLRPRRLSRASTPSGGTATAVKVSGPRPRVLAGVTIRAAGAPAVGRGAARRSASSSRRIRSSRRRSDERRTTTDAGTPAPDDGDPRRHQHDDLGSTSASAPASAPVAAARPLDERDDHDERQGVVPHGKGDVPAGRPALRPRLAEAKGWQDRRRRRLVRRRQDDPPRQGQEGDARRRRDGCPLRPEARIHGQSRRSRRRASSGREVSTQSRIAVLPECGGTLLSRAGRSRADRRT